MKFLAPFLTKTGSFLVCLLLVNDTAFSPLGWVLKPWTPPWITSVHQLILAVLSRMHSEPIRLSVSATSVQTTIIFAYATAVV